MGKTVANCFLDRKTQKEHEVNAVNSAAEHHAAWQPSWTWTRTIALFNYQLHSLLDIYQLLRIGVLPSLSMRPFIGRIGIPSVHTILVQHRETF